MYLMFYCFCIRVVWQ